MEGAKPVNKTLSLKNVEVYFDPETAAIEVTSHDKRLDSGKLKLSVSAHTESYKTLLKFLVDNGKADVEQMELPSSKDLHIQDAKQLLGYGDNPQTKILIGRGLGNRPVEVDFNSHVLICGGIGSGKSITMRNILCAGLESSRVEICAIDLKRIELGPYAFRPQDSIAFTQEEALKMLTGLNDKLLERYELLESRGVNSYVNTELPAIYVVIDELANLTQLKSIGDRFEHSDETVELWNARRVLINQILIELARKGRAAGINLIIGSQLAQNMDPELLKRIHTRILMGRARAAETEWLFGRSSVYGSAYLEPRGRGVMETWGTQTIFQSYFIPFENYRASK